MKLTHIAILAIRGSKGMVQKLSEALDCSDTSVYRYIADNDILLTTAAALKVIREETGLTDDQILEETEPARA